MARLNIDNVDPKVVGLIYEHKAAHNHQNLAETLKCLVEKAMGICKKLETFDDIDVDPEVITLIRKHKTVHNHQNDADALKCLVEKATNKEIEMKPLVIEKGG